MKRLLLSSLLLGISLLVGCGGSSSGNNPPPTVTLVSIAISPASPSITVGATQQFSATGTYSDGSTKSLTTAVNWVSSSQSVATVNTAGLATAVAAGTTTITASSGSITGTTTLTVTPGVTLVSIAITPASTTIAIGGTQQFSAKGTYSDGSTQILTTTASWLSSNPAVATINASGLATGVAVGTTNITASSAGITGTATVNVAAPPLVSIALTPLTASVAPNATQQFTATGTYADHSTKNITASVTWSASVGATITAGGLATGITPNSTSTIMAAVGSISGTATLTVTNPLVSIAVTPATASIAATFTQQFAATGTYADHSTTVITTSVTWASSNPGVATISNSVGTQGVATGVAAGTSSITATLNGIISPPASLTVTSATLVSIAVTPVTPILVFQTQQQFTATGTFSDSTTQDITSSVTWSSSDPTKITIVATGLATGVGVTSSPVTITATKSPGTPGTTTATVVPPTLTSIAITSTTATSDPTTLAQGTSRQYTATGTESNGSTLNITAQATWTSSDITIATVGIHNGLVKAAASVPNNSNPVTITASFNGVSQNLLLDVTNTTVQSITVTPITATIPVGITQRFVATATFSDATTQDISSSASWSSSNLAVANVSAGLASGLSSGNSTISATFGGQTGSAQLTVSTVTLQSISITPVSTILAPASTIIFQAVGHYSDASTQTLQNATWNSSNPSSVTIVSPSGTATGQSPGTSNITASYQGVTSNTANVIVNQFPLVSIAVTPLTANVPVSVSVPFSATGTFSDQSTQNLTTNVTWASSQPSVATIGNATGQQGLATGVTPGQTTITGVFASVVSASATLTVTNATLVSIAVTPNNQTVTHGAALQFTATGTFSDSSVINLTGQVVWSSSNATVATINANGVANTANPGTTVITATFTQNGLQVSGTTNLTVQ